MRQQTRAKAPPLAILNGTLLDGEICAGQFFCFPLPITVENIKEATDYLTSVASDDRRIARSWAATNDESYNERPCEMEVRLFDGTERQAHLPRQACALENSPPLLTFNLEQPQTSFEALATTINGLTERTPSVVVTRIQQSQHRPVSDIDAASKGPETQFR